MKTKFIIPSFAFYDRTGIQKYLEKHAARGWMLDKVSNLYWRFCRMEPKKLRFCVTYFPQADIYDPVPSEAEETFREFCAHGGWSLAGSNAQMQIFWTDSDEAMPIETDPVMEVENIHKSMKKGALKAYWLLVISSLLNFVSQGIHLSSGLVNYLSNGLNLVLAATWILLFVLSVVRLAIYYGWRSKAKRAAREDGIFVDTVSIMWAENLVAAVILLGWPAVILTLKDRRMATVLGFCFAMAFVVLILVELFRRFLKNLGYEAAESKKAVLILCLVLGLAMCYVGIPVVSSRVLNSEGYKAQKAQAVALNIRELLGEEAADHIPMVLTDNDSLLLGYQRVYQYPDGSLTIPNLEYNLVEVRAKWLYERCRAELMTVPKVYMEGGEYRPIDPAPWGAEEAWQMFDGEQLRDWYVLCYADAILKIVPSWELAPEQMAAVGEKFG